MSKTKEPDHQPAETSCPASTIEPERQGLLHRLVLPIQTRGNLGKSTEAIARCEWMNARGIQWKGFDLDASNRTLSTALPDDVSFVPLTAEPEGQVVRILRGVTKAEVTVIDPSAHMEQTILRAFRMVRFPQMAAAAQARATVMVYPIDEISDMDDIARTVDALGDTVDWIVVRNLARVPTTRFYERSALEKQLGHLGAARLDIPPLLTDTRNYLRTQEAKLGRAFSPSQALSDPTLELDLGHQMILEDWLGEFFSRLDQIASHLLPTASLERIPVPKPVVPPSIIHRRGSSINLGNGDE
ncbi:MAG: ATPase [Chthoniobacter sp.]|uniref:ATPase n=1 Tax=Chthoniobacter sp. TaxID=2510640 RepID=UPI0032A9A262